MSDDSLVIVPPTAPPARLTEDQWRLVQRTYAKDATPDEFALFRKVAESEGLDPFRKQIHFIKRKAGDINFVVSVHGLVARLNRVAGFRGITSAAVHKSDTFSCDPANAVVAHTFGLARGPLVGAWARGQVGNRAPIVRWVTIEEYRGSSPLWQSKPATMIEKVAIVQVARALAPEQLSDLYAAEEFGGESSASGSVTLVAETSRASRLADSDAATIAAALETLEACPDLETLEAVLVGIRAEAAAWPPSARKLYKSHVERRRGELTPPAPIVDAEIDASAGEVREPGSDE